MGPQGSREQQQQGSGGGGLQRGGPGARAPEARHSPAGARGVLNGSQSCNPVGQRGNRRPVGEL